jgi:hypothetical protein
LALARDIFWQHGTGYFSVPEEEDSSTVSLSRKMSHGCLKESGACRERGSRCRKQTGILPQQELKVVSLPDFWHVVVSQLLLINLCLIAKADTSAMVSSTGNSVLMVIAYLIGAMNIAPFKYMWWFAGILHHLTTHLGIFARNK